MHRAPRGQGVSYELVYERATEPDADHDLQRAPRRGGACTYDSGAVGPKAAAVGGRSAPGRYPVGGWPDPRNHRHHSRRERVSGERRESRGNRSERDAASRASYRSGRSMSAIASMITAYLEATAAEGYATSTLSNRRRHLGQFASWCEAREPRAGRDHPSGARSLPAVALPIAARRRRARLGDAGPQAHRGADAPRLGGAHEPAHGESRGRARRCHGCRSDSRARCSR